VSVPAAREVIRVVDAGAIEEQRVERMIGETEYGRFFYAMPPDSDRH
jgi:hypothetical protein